MKQAFLCDCTETRPGGYGGLAYAIIIQAVEDIKGLQNSGILRGAECFEPWPLREQKGKTQPFACYGCRSCADVERLLDFFFSGYLERMLDIVGSDVNPDKVRAALFEKEVDCED